MPGLFWLFRERIAKHEGKEKELWSELQKQLDKYKLKVKQGKVEDVTFIEKGGWRAEGVHGPIVPIAPHTGYAQDSTIIDADPGVPTEEDVKRREEAKKKRGEKKKAQVEQTNLQKNEAPANALTPFAKKIETKPRGKEAYTRRSKDGTWTRKNERSFSGYKLHTKKSDLSSGFVSDFAVTPQLPSMMRM
ncbi:MAG: hypothetical protein ACRDF4_02840 [Rhabdochlamydiaceae bacterium]